METKDIIDQIEKLPVNQRILIIEQTLKSIREKEFNEKMTRAVNELQEEYRMNKELIAFTDIDFDDFYETR